MLMKRDDDRQLPDEVEGYLKREFSAEQRREAASSGAAMKDGSFPIKNSSDLHNAMQAIGRAKNPGATKAHIRRRARALGLSSELSDAFKGSRFAEFIESLFTVNPVGEPVVSEIVTEATESLAESVKSIIDDGAEDKDAMLAKTFTQFHSHLETELGKSLSGDRASAVKQPAAKENPMTAALLKALGLTEDTSEENALKAIAEILANQKRGRKKEENGNGNGNGKPRDEEEEEDEEETEKAFKALPESVRKRLAEGKTALEEVNKLRKQRELDDLRKRAVAMGLPEDMGEVIQKAFDHDNAAIEKLLDVTKTSIAQAKSAGLLSERGYTGGHRVAGNTAYEQIKALAAELRKTHPDMSEAQAFTKVYADPAHRDLVIQDAQESGRA